MRLRLAAACTTCILLASCTAATGAQEDVPAVVSQSTPEFRAELRRAVEQVLGAPVTLADDALTREDTLIVERNPLRDDSGRRIEIREREPPAVFRLVRRGNRCVLIHERTQQTTALESAPCVPR
jgi:hypothetical protein